MGRATVRESTRGMRNSWPENWKISSKRWILLIYTSCHQFQTSWNLNNDSTNDRLKKYITTGIWLSKVAFFQISRSVESKMASLKYSLQWWFAPRKWPFLRSKKVCQTEVDMATRFVFGWLGLAGPSCWKTPLLSACHDHPAIFCTFFVIGLNAPLINSPPFWQFDMFLLIFWKGTRARANNRTSY